MRLVKESLLADFSGIDEVSAAFEGLDLSSDHARQHDSSSPAKPIAFSKSVIR